jgi:membrane protease subunit HflK
MDDVVTKSVKGTLLQLGKFFIRWVLFVLLIIYMLTGVYSIPQNEVGVLQRFGRVIDGEVKPGIHYALPWPIDKVEKVPVKVVNSIVIDDFSRDFAPNSPATTFQGLTGLTPYCITGDNNIVSIGLVIKYNITNPVSYLFSIKNNQLLLRDVAGSTIIHCLAELPVDEILTYGKKRIEDYVRLNLQRELDEVNSGLGISFIELKEVSPPKSVQQYFDDVINASIDKRKMINNAESYRNERIPRAKGDAEKIIQEANAYKKERISRAEGEAKRFLAQLAEYSDSKEVTRRRLHLEFIHSVYPSLKNIIIMDNKEGKKLINIKIFPK